MVDILECDNLDFSTEIQLVLLMLSVHVVERIGIQLGSVVGIADGFRR